MPEDRVPDEASPPHGRRAESLAALAFIVAIVAALGLVVVYWTHGRGQPQLEGTLLSVVTGGIGAGIVIWAKHFMPHGPFTEPRGQISSSGDERAAFVADFERGGEEIGRRGFLARLLAAAFGALGLAMLLPIRSLGPRPGRGLKQTGYRTGVRLVTEDGKPVGASTLAVGGVLTVYPENDTDAGDAPTLLIHLAPGANKPRPGRLDWAAAGDLVAYSKLCSHMGCPVGLYQAEEGLLLCPCHQSTFDVRDGCRPIFGPASRSLEQLPIAVDVDGNLVARGDFSGPVGPGFWDRDE
jgi:ubiquinol-cytochrome c reductase iron-sulfur subunit